MLGYHRLLLELLKGFTLSLQMLLKLPTEPILRGVLIQILSVRDVPKGEADRWFIYKFSQSFQYNGVWHLFLLKTSSIRKVIGIGNWNYVYKIYPIENIHTSWTHEYYVGFRVSISNLISINSHSLCIIK